MPSLEFITRFDDQGNVRVELSGISDELDKIGKKGSGTGVFEQISRDLQRTGQNMRQLGGDVRSVGNSLTLGLTVPIVGAGAAAIKLGSDFETAFAGVRKTVNATEEEFAILRQGFRDLSKEIPVSANELARIGEAAGQLGIRTENILGFTRVMADLGVTTNLSSEEAATSLARFANIVGTSQQDFDRLGSAIVDLGNNFATTEREIVELSLRLAGAGKQVGLTEGEIFGLATALSSLGVEAEAGGTAFSRILIEIEKSVSLAASGVADGQKQLQLFANVAGLTADEFSQAFRSNAAEAVTLFVERLGQVQESGGSVSVVLDALGLDAVRVADSLRRTASGGDLLREAIQRGNTAFQENTALAREAAQRYETFASQLSILKNELVDVGVELFQSIRPVLVESIIPAARDAVKLLAVAVEAFGQLPQPVQTATFAMAGMVAVLGPILSGLGSLITVGGQVTGLLGKLLGGFTSLRAALGSGTGILGRFGASFAGVIGSMGTLSGVMRAVLGLFSGPVGWIATIATVVGLMIDWSATTASFTRIWESMKDAFGISLDILGRTFSALGDVASQLFEVGLRASGLGDILSDLSGLFGGLSDLLTAGLIIFLEQFNQQIQTSSRVLIFLAETFGIYDEAAAKAARSSLEFGDSLTYGPTLEQLTSSVQIYGPSLDLARKNTEGATSALGPFSAGLDDAAQRAKQAADEIRRLKEGLGDSLSPLGQLEDRLRKVMTGQGSFSEAQVIAAWRDEIVQAVVKQRELNQQLGIGAPALDKWTASVVEAGLKTGQLNLSMFGLGDTLDDLPIPARNLGAQMDALGLSVDKVATGQGLLSQKTLDVKGRFFEWQTQTRNTSQAIRELIGAGFTAEQILELMGSEINDATRFSELFEIQLDDTTRAVIEQGRTLQENARRAKQWEDAWGNAIGEVVGGFIDGIRKMEFSLSGFVGNLIDTVKDLGKTLFSLVIGGIFEPILRAATQFGRNLGAIIGNVIFGTPGPQGGIFGGVFNGFGGGLLGKGIKGLGGLLGIGGGAAGATGLAAALGGAGIGSLPLTGGAIGAAGGIGAFSLFGPGAATLAGGAGAAGAAGAGAAGAAGAGGAAAGAGGFSILGLSGIPLFGALAAGGFFGIKGLIDLFSNTPTEAGSKEIARDFGIKVGENAVKGFLKDLGLSDKQFEPFRKSILGSPKGVEFLIEEARKFGPAALESLASSFGRFQVSEAFRPALESSTLKFTSIGRDFLVDMSAEVRQAIEGDFSALNAAFLQLQKGSGLVTSGLGLDRFLSDLVNTKDAADSAGEKLSDLGDSGAASLRGLAAAMQEVKDSLLAGFEDLISRLDALLTNLDISLDGLTNKLRTLRSEAVSAGQFLDAQELPINREFAFSDSPQFSDGVRVRSLRAAEVDFFDEVPSLASGGIVRRGGLVRADDNEVFLGRGSGGQLGARVEVNEGDLNLSMNVTVSGSTTPEHAREIGNELGDAIIERLIRDTRFNVRGRGGRLEESLARHRQRVR